VNVITNPTENLASRLCGEGWIAGLTPGSKPLSADHTIDIGIKQ